MTMTEESYKKLQTRLPPFLITDPQCDFGKAKSSGVQGPRGKSSTNTKTKALLTSLPCHSFPNVGELGVVDKR
jgi:hypothetical protein